MNTDEQLRLLGRILWLVALFIAALMVGGATAIPIEGEVKWLASATGAHPLVDAPGSTAAPAWAAWLCGVEGALNQIGSQHPFIGYGGDWLAFGHFVIALAFVGAWREPVRNRWLFDFGLLACAARWPGLACGWAFGPRARDARRDASWRAQASKK